MGSNIFYNQILKLQEHKSNLEKQLETLQSDESHKEEPISFNDFQKFTKGLKALIEKCVNPDEHSALIRKLVERLEVTPNGIVIQYLVGKTHYSRELGDQADHGLMPIGKSNPTTETIRNHVLATKKGLADCARPASKPLVKYRLENSFVEGSNTLTNGRGRGIRTPDPPVMSRLL